MKLRRYWLRFDLASYERPPIGIRLGCGVTAYSYDDALTLIQEQLFEGLPLPPVVDGVEDVDVSELDENHVRPNMGSPVTRGVWFPLS